MTGPRRTAVTVVTGGASGIGLPFASHFARQGRRIVIADLCGAADFLLGAGTAFVIGQTVFVDGGSAIE